ncbi:S8 family serine peptidase [Fodinicola feengrottensis]|uniref:S8 family serine peptidase n=1 Tax=Fodinicola feengrottensis TaxID=435914 RepID=UPI0013D1F60A|nr:S8 family serine peptidase [Fodinicola feengrottensis]
MSWSADHGARVINLSIAHDANHPLAASVPAAVQYAQEKDVVIVAGAGNVAQSGLPVSLFAALPGVVAVSGADKKGNFWTGSSYGPQVAVAAPAVDMVGPTIPSVSATGYITGSGTSDATAVTSGCVALIRAKFPSMDANNVINRLIKTAVPPSDKKRSIYLGFGTVAPYRALTENVPTVTTNPLGGTPATTPSTAPGSNNSQPTTDNPGPNLIPWLIGAGICLIVVLAIVILIVVLVSRRRRPPPPGPYGTGFPPGPPYR